MQDVILYATDTMADWEYGYLTAGLTMANEMEPDRFRLRVLADGQSEVTTAGRLRLGTDGDIGEVDADRVALLVLPGATLVRGQEGARVARPGERARDRRDLRSRTVCAAGLWTPPHTATRSNPGVVGLAGAEQYVHERWWMTRRDHRTAALGGLQCRDLSPDRAVSPA